MVLDMVYNFFSDKSLRSNFLYENLVKIDNILNEKIFNPFLMTMFNLNTRTIQSELSSDLAKVGDSGKYYGPQLKCKSWYYDSKQLATIIKSTRS